MSRLQSAHQVIQEHVSLFISFLSSPSPGSAPSVLCLPGLRGPGGGKSKIGIIGGTGLDDPEILEGRTEKYVDTPFGKPSDALILGKIKNVDCVLLARHGRQHSIMPSNVNYQANIWALKEEGCTHVIVTTACGSLREEIQPGDIVIIDQFIDRTTKRPQTFYDGSHACARGVCHIPMAEPFCPKTREDRRWGRTCATPGPHSLTEETRRYVGEALGPRRVPRRPLPCVPAPPAGEAPGPQLPGSGACRSC
ncbi:S-methyl-5'-thioadenosine phosphorylase isoform X3 [Canis lupus dingo]|uniref:S-methyl-5'-thioadenosine phosphorylase isoform X3 n=1 Tax=Canis lupus dingo TaxID=286419 RepID=UPI0020C59682|nr:S-methyl-5'-thioadenosine phosphorylase isoform X3 [Canis lupus dingo]